jgi:hypothetical protein
MSLAFRITAAMLAALLAGGVPAASTDSEREIAHLLDYIQSSGCTFVRNGTPSDAAGARAHVARKYDYVRSRVRSAEDFIRLAATQSSMSGEPYHVRCGGQDSLTNAWLTQELARYRSSARRP